MTTHNVLSKMLSRGHELLVLGGKTLNVHSYDMLPLFTGSEGLFGVIVEVTVKLLAVPERAQVVLAAFDDRLVLVS